MKAINKELYKEYYSDFIKIGNIENEWLMYYKAVAVFLKKTVKNNSYINVSLNELKEKISKLAPREIDQLILCLSDNPNDLFDSPLAPDRVVNPYTKNIGLPGDLLRHRCKEIASNQSFNYSKSAYEKFFNRKL